MNLFDLSFRQEELAMVFQFQLEHGFDSHSVTEERCITESLSKEMN